MAELEVKARPVAAVIPSKLTDRERLSGDLEIMGLKKLLQFPWRICELSLIDQGLWDRGESAGVRARPSAWTEALIGEVYAAPKVGEDLQKVDGEPRSYIESLFVPETFKRKNGWLAEHCLEISMQHLFRFLSPIFHPESQSRITLSFAATVVFSLEQRKVINWAQLLHRVIHMQIKNFQNRSRLGRLRSMTLTPYLAHIYHEQKCLLPSEARIYQIQLATIRTDVGERPVEAPVHANATLLALCEMLACGEDELIPTVSRLKGAPEPVHHPIELCTPAERAEHEEHDNDFGEPLAFDDGDQRPSLMEMSSLPSDTQGECSKMPAEGLHVEIPQPASVREGFIEEVLLSSSPSTEAHNLCALASLQAYESEDDEYQVYYNRRKRLRKASALVEDSPDLQELKTQPEVFPNYVESSSSEPAAPEMPLKVPSPASSSTSDKASELPTKESVIPCAPPGVIYRWKGAPSEDEDENDPRIIRVPPRLRHQRVLPPPVPVPNLDTIASWGKQDYYAAFRHLEIESIRQQKQILPSIYIPSIRTLISTYKFPKIVPPIDKDRRHKFSAYEIWCWVYTVRRTGCPFPPLTPDRPWSTRYDVWVAHDGYAIPFKYESELVRLRGQLQRNQLMVSFRAKGRQEIKNLVQLPLVEVWPPRTF